MKVLLTGMWAFLLIVLFPLTAFSQHMLDKNSSFISISGTSTLHDWEASAEQVDGTLFLEDSEENALKVRSAKIAIIANSLKSGKAAMDKNMYKALKTEEHSTITYQLENHDLQSEKGTAKGRLTIAGVTKAVEVRVVQEHQGKRLQIKGEIGLKMSDFGIEPPVFLLGTLKTGDDITIAFQFTFNEQNGQTNRKQ